MSLFQLVLLCRQKPNSLIYQKYRLATDSSGWNSRLGSLSDGPPREAKWVCHRVCVTLPPIWNIIEWCKSSLVTQPGLIFSKGGGQRIEEAITLRNTSFNGALRSYCGLKNEPIHHLLIHLHNLISSTSMFHVQIRAIRQN